MSNDDIRHLDLLAIFHYVVGAILAVFACIPFMHVFMGIAFLSGSFFGESAGAQPPPVMGWMFVIMGSVLILFGWSLAICVLIAGSKLRKRVNRIYCMVVAGIECMFMPFGTVLGVFTLIVLSKDSVKVLFGETVSSPSPPAPSIREE